MGGWCCRAGMSYRMLVLAGGDHLTLAAARHLEALVKAGATVLGPMKPVGSPSFGDGAAGDAEVRRIADELWGPGVPNSPGEHQTGLGTMAWGRSPADELALLGAPKDFEATGADVDILFAHRRSEQGDILFSRQPSGCTRVIRPGTSGPDDGGMPQDWNPQTGAISALAGAARQGPLTSVPIQLEAHESLFRRLPRRPGPGQAYPGFGGSAAGLAKPRRPMGGEL